MHWWSSAVAPIQIRDTAFWRLQCVARNGNAAGSVHEGVIYLFRDELGDRLAVQRSLFHEWLHLGLRNFMTLPLIAQELLVHGGIDMRCTHGLSKKMLSWFA